MDFQFKPPTKVIWPKRKMLRPFFLYQGFPKDKVQKRDADVEEALMITGDSEVTLHSKTYWVNLFNGFAEMTDPISSDLGLFLYCMLN